MPPVLPHNSETVTQGLGTILLMDGPEVVLQYVSPEPLRNRTVTLLVDGPLKPYVHIGENYYLQFNARARRRPDGAVFVDGVEKGNCTLRNLDDQARLQRQGQDQGKKAPAQQRRIDGYTRNHAQPAPAGVPAATAREVDRAYRAGQLTPAQAAGVYRHTGGSQDADGIWDMDGAFGSAWLAKPQPLPLFREEGLRDSSYLRLGYVALTVDTPLEDIQVQETTEAETVAVLRSRAPIQKNNWHAGRSVTLSLTFNGSHAVNAVLLPILRLFRRVPFLPVYNTILEDHDISALTLGALEVQTLPGFPQALKCVLTCFEFNWRSYLPQAASLDDQFNWPLLKLWVENRGSRLPTTAGSAVDPALDFHLPLPRRWDGTFQLWTMDESWLQSIVELPDRQNRNATLQGQRDAALQAGSYAQLAAVPAAPQGFKPGTGAAAPGQAGERRALGGDVGLIRWNGLLGDSTPADTESGVHAVVLFRARSLDAARVLAQQSDLRLVFRAAGGALEFQRVDPETAGEIDRAFQRMANPNGNAGALGVRGSDDPRDVQAARNAQAGRLDQSAGPVWSAVGNSFNGPFGAQSSVHSPEEFRALLRAVDHDQTTLRNVELGTYVFAFPVGTEAFARLAQALQALRTQGDAGLDAEQPVPDRRFPFTPPSMIVEQVSCSLQNIVANQQVRGQRTPAHQYLGSSAVYWTITGVLENEHDAATCVQFLERVNELARRYPGRADGSPFGGGVLVENEIFRLLGTRQVLPLAFGTATIPSFPGSLRFQLTVVEFDPTQRRLEKLEHLIPGFNPDDPNSLMRSVESEHDPIQVRWLRTREFHQRLEVTELYPDLLLPRHDELRKWAQDVVADKVWDWEHDRPFPDYWFLAPSVGGTGWEWSREDRYRGSQRIAAGLDWAFVLQIQEDAPPATKRFADPDFFCWSCQEWGATQVDRVVQAAMQQPWSLGDTYGTQTLPITIGTRVSEHVTPAHLDPKGTMQAAQDSAGRRDVPPLGARMSPVDDARHGKLDLQGPGAVANPGVGPVPERDSAIPGSLQGPTGQAAPKGSLPISSSRDMAQRIQQYAPTALAAARAAGVDPALFMGLIEQESQWDQRATSRAGAHGLVQLMPRTAAGLGVDRYDPADNLRGGATLLGRLLRKYGGNVDNALRAYNWGEGNLDGFLAGRKHTMPAETQEYAPKVRARAARYRRLVDSSGPGSSQGATAGKAPGTPAAQPSARDAQLRQEVRREVEQWAAAFRNGSGWKRADLEALVVGSDKFFGEQVAGDPVTITAPRRPDAFLRSYWIERITTFTSYGSAAPSPDMPGSTLPPDFDEYGVVHAQYLEAFVLARRQAKVTMPALVPSIRNHDVYSNLPLPGPLHQPTPAPNANDFNDPDHKVRIPQEVVPTLEETFFNPTTGEDMFHDLRRGLLQGRLLGAFPTFYVALVDGGRHLRVWRLFDHLYGMHAVTRINVHRRREGPVETAVLGFANMYGHLTSQVADLDRSRKNDTRGSWFFAAVRWDLAGAAAELKRGFEGMLHFDQETIAMWAAEVNALMLKPGTRLHIRMGFGSSANELPIVFNGTISEVGPQEGEVQVVALSDGLELTNDLPPTDLQGSTPVTRINTMTGGGRNPREIVMQYLNPLDAGTQLAQFAGRHINPIFYYGLRNPYGIEHFGKPVRYSLQMDGGECGINLYNPQHAHPTNQSSAWDNTLTILQPWIWGEGSNHLIGINLAKATPWDIANVCRKTVPDYVLYPMPVELRSTLFMGKPWFPVYTNYRTEAEDLLKADPDHTPKEKFFHKRPFQQFHLLHSAWNLIGNDVKGDSSEVYTKVQAVGTYNGWSPGAWDLSNESSFVMMLDEDIYDNFQRMKVVESGLYTTVNMKAGDSLNGMDALLNAVVTAAGVLTGNVPVAVGGLVGLIGGPLVRWLQSRRVNDYYAAMELKDSVKKMYAGSLAIQGNGWIKPFDLFHVTDELSGLNGMAEVREVTHTMNLGAGFVTEVVPDCLAVHYDYDGLELYQWVGMTAARFGTGMAVAAVMGKLAQAQTTRWLVRNIRQLKDFLLGKANAAVRAGQARIGDLDNLAVGTALNRVKELEDVLRQAGRNPTKVREILDEMVVDADGVWAGVWKTLPGTLRARIKLQRLLHWATGRAGEIGSKLRELGQEGRDGVFDLLGDGLKGARTELDDATRAILAKGFTGDEIARLNALRQGSNAAEELAKLGPREKELLTALEEVDRLKGAVRGWSRAGQVAKSVEGLAGEAKAAFTGGASKAAGMAVITAVVMALVGGLSDWVKRWAVARQCLTLMPLRIWDHELTAGIDGHRGAVFGDPIGEVDTILQWGMDWVRKTPFGVGFFIPVLGDLAQSGLEYSRPQLAQPLPAPTPGR